MRKRMLVLLLAIFVMGCGSQTTEKPSEEKTTVAKKPSNYVEKGMNYLKQQDITKAIRSFDLAIKEDPNNSVNYIILGEVYLRLKDYVRAADTFRASTKVDPDNGEAYYLLAAANAVMQRQSEGEKAEFFRKEAVDAAQKSVEIYMKHKDAERFKKAVVLLRSLSESGSAQ